MNCNATDFYAERHYPVYLYYNPHKESKSVKYSAKGIVDLFDIISKEYVAKNVSSDGTFEMPAGDARIIVELPAGTRLTTDNNKVVADGKYTIAYK